MPSNPILAGVACGAAIGLGALVVIDAATDTADAQSGFTVSAGKPLSLIHIAEPTNTLQISEAGLCVKKK